MHGVPIGGTTEEGTAVVTGLLILKTPATMGAPPEALATLKVTPEVVEEEEDTREGMPPVQ